MSADPGPSPDESDPSRPDLHVVRAADTAAADDADDETTESDSDVPPETPVETTGPVPVVNDDGEAITPQAPIDVRIRQMLLGAVRALPALSEPPASFRESLEYSQTGDWAVRDNTGKRAVHGIATVLAYVLTYPVVDLPAKARSKPIGFILCLALLVAVLNIV